MMVRLLETVPNFSEGRDARVVRAIVDAMRANGADVLDWSMDPDHHRSVVTAVGPPEVVEEAALAAARVAIERIDLARHRGVHPRIGALDVLPFVPLLGLSLSDARSVARRVGHRLATELGLPVYFYAEAADPAGRTLAALRRGGYELLVKGWPAGRTPDVLPDGWRHPGAHPTAGATCVGARRVLLAWNVVVEGITIDAARRIAAGLRESSGGIAGVRALAVELASRGALQISMNLEDPAASPLVVFRRIEAALHTEGGRVVETEVVGLVPDALVVAAAEERLRLVPGTGARLLSGRLLDHLAGVREPEPRDEAERGE